jgi:hypothetical protein
MYGKIFQLMSGILFLLAASLESVILLKTGPAVLGAAGGYARFSMKVNLKVLTLGMSGMLFFAGSESGARSTPKNWSGRVMGRRRLCPIFYEAKLERFSRQTP